MLVSVNELHKEREVGIRPMAMVGAAFLLICLTAGCATAAHGQPPAPGNVLAGTAWTLVSLNGDPLVEGTAVTLRFDNTAVEGTGGCNTYSGSYTASEDSLNLGDVVRTEMACPEPEGVFEQEQAYFRALGDVAQYRVDGERLELQDGNGVQILEFAIATADPAIEDETRTVTAPEFLLDCTLEVDEITPAGGPVNLVFELHNASDRPLYVLTWYTPLEGMTGELLSVTQDGTQLPYEGALVKRGDPTRDEYVRIGPGETVSADVDLSRAYDLSTPGSYQVEFTVGLRDVTDDASVLPRMRDDHRPQSLSCNAADFSTAPASPTVTAIPTDVAPASTPEPPAGFRRYVNGTSGVSLWVPESWTVIEPGPHSPILQSYPQDKYVGGEPRQPGDTKCDLTIHPAGTGMADVIQQIRSAPLTTIVSERELLLQSGRSGMRLEVDSMGRALSLITSIEERAVVLTCFGDLASFDEMAATLGTSD